jgi:RNA polymerase sigma-70 factor (ECF subfamily)
MSAHAIGEQFVGILGQREAATPLQTLVSQLFEETRDDVYRYLLTLGLHPPVAQETVQDVFLKLYATLKKGENIQNPRGWVFRVAHNHGLKTRAHQNSEEAFDPDLEARLISPAATAEHELIERERLLGFHRAVEGLSEQQKRCLFLRMEGLRYPEIASALGISASAVGEFLRRAVLRLKKVRNG